MEYLVLVAIGVGLLGVSQRLPERRRAKRDLARKVVVSISTLRDGGSAAIRGKVSATDGVALLTSPMTSLPCVYWRVTFEEVGTGGDSRELGRAEQGQPFLVADDTGVARVVPGSPLLALPGEERFQPITVLDLQLAGSLTEIARRVCKRANYPTSLLRTTEYTIAPGSAITIAGVTTREPDPGASERVSGYRAELPSRPVISGSKRQRVLIG